MKRKQPSDGTIVLQVLCLTGEGLTLEVRHSTLGQEVYRMVAQRLPCKPGAGFLLYHLESKLVLHQTLEEQGIVGEATVSCTRVPTNLFDASGYIVGRMSSENGSVLEGVTRLECGPEHWCSLPETLESLTFSDEFNRSLEQLLLPSSLQRLNFGNSFNQSLEHVIFPKNLQSLTFGMSFDQSLERVGLPSGLQSLTSVCASTKAWSACLCCAIFKF